MGAVAGNVLDSLAIAPSSPQLTEGFGEELIQQQRMLQQMQQDIAYQVDSILYIMNISKVMHL